MYSGNGDASVLDTRNGRVDDGTYHKVSVTKGTKLLKVTVDDGRVYRMRLKTPTFDIQSPMYVGTPENIPTPNGMVKSVYTLYIN